jgi:hypothetical protein
VGGFGRGGEDVGEKKVAYATLLHVRLWFWLFGNVGEFTVASTPTNTTTRLKLCCVVRTAFSPGERSDHLTCPVSPVNVMLLRCGPGVGFGVELCVACALRLVAKVARPSGALRVDEGCMRGSMNEGRRSAMASLGLYIAAMAMVNMAAREL